MHPVATSTVQFNDPESKSDDGTRGRLKRKHIGNRSDTDMIGSAARRNQTASWRTDDGREAKYRAGDGAQDTSHRESPVAGSCGTCGDERSVGLLLDMHILL
jgi:hypothetical protein